jgi:hypothetical protein
MDIKETIEFTKIMDGLSRLYPKLPNYAAITAVNFYKERFVVQRDIYDKPLKKRTSDTKKDKGRAIEVKSGRFKRDIQKILVTDTRAIVGTTRLTAPYAKAQNEGFKGTVTVRAHGRNRYKKVKEAYTDKNGRARNRTSKQVDTDKEKIQVGTFRRNMNLPERRVMGVSPLVDRRIQKTVTSKIIENIKENSSYGPSH